MSKLLMSTKKKEGNVCKREGKWDFCGEKKFFQLCMIFQMNFRGGKYDFVSFVISISF